MASHNELGKEGEELAVKYLSNLGYEILETNFRFKRDEVDIIASKNDFIVFVEVKTRANNFLGEPEEAVSVSKQKRIIKPIKTFVFLQKYFNSFNPNPKE